MEFFVSYYTVECCVRSELLAQSVYNTVLIVFKAFLPWAQISKEDQRVEANRRFREASQRADEAADRAIELELLAEEAARQAEECRRRIKKEVLERYKRRRENPVIRIQGM